MQLEQIDRSLKKSAVVKKSSKKHQDPLEIPSLIIFWNSEAWSVTEHLFLTNRPWKTALVAVLDNITSRLCYFNNYLRRYAKSSAIFRRYECILKGEGSAV